MSGSAESTSVTIFRTTTESSTTITLIGFTRVLLLPCWAQPNRLFTALSARVPEA
jgi:hypothetical protein